jgi:hypothetical protein
VEPVDPKYRTSSPVESGGAPTGTSGGDGDTSGDDVVEDSSAVGNGEDLGAIVAALSGIAVVLAGVLSL